MRDKQYEIYVVGTDCYENSLTRTATDFDKALAMAKDAMEIFQKHTIEQLRIHSIDELSDL